MVNRISVRVRFCCRSGESASLRLRMSLVSCDLNADNGRCADALISQTHPAIILVRTDRHIFRSSRHQSLNGRASVPDRQVRLMTDYRCWQFRYGSSFIRLPPGRQSTACDICPPPISDPMLSNSVKTFVKCHLSHA